MTSTMSPAVEDYLRRLRRASRWLPASQAEELQEQVTSHLLEALPPAAGHQLVDRVLIELGEPTALVREAAGTPRRRLRTRVRRVRTATWMISAVLLVAVITGAVLVTLRVP